MDITKLENGKVENKGFKLVSPWVNLYRKIEALFGQDPDIKINFDNDNRTITLYVDGQEKYEALSQFIPATKELGNVKVTIKVIPANNAKLSNLDLFRNAFKGNPVVDDFITVPRELIDSTNNFDYVVFKKEVVQYHDDSLSDPHGNCSTLYQLIADDIFENRGGVYFCTSRD
jgi:hypothetical protein